MSKKQLKRLLDAYADGEDIQSLFEEAYEYGFNAGYDEGEEAGKSWEPPNMGSEW